MRRGSLLVYGWLLVIAVVGPALVRGKTACSGYNDYDLPFFEQQYSHLFSKLEEALINNTELMEQLRHGFMSTESIQIIFFNFQLEVINGSDLIICTDDYHTHECTFCPLEHSHKWILCCNYSLDMTFSSQSLGSLQLEEADIAILWLSLLHGSIISVLEPFFIWPLNYGYEGDSFYFNDLTLKIDKLDSNPSLHLTKCVLSKLISWVKVYSEFGGIPHESWDQSQKGTVTFDDTSENNNGIKFIWPINSHVFVKLSMTEYMFVSLSLALVIAKFFPAIHDQLVSRATRLEHQSIYWGTVVVSNIFTYGLLFLAMRVWSLSVDGFVYLLNLNLVTSVMISNIPYIQEVVVHVILFVGALIASLRGHHHGTEYHVPISSATADILISISFFWSCFLCCCKCCSLRRRVKIMKFLVLFGFMSFVYRSIMDVISIAFAMFIEKFRPTVITSIMLYISLIVFLALFVSFSLFNLFKSSNDNLSFCRQFCNCFGGLCMFLTVFPTVILIVIMYMIIVMSLNLTGVIGILTGLIPSLVLSAASWYIKTKLLKRALTQTSNTIQDQPECGTERMSNGEREENTGDQRMLLP